MKKIALIVILILFVSIFLGADVYTKSVERVKAFELMGKKQPETLQMKDRWYGKNKYAEIGKDFNMIIDLDKEKMFLVVHEAKVYFEVPTNLDGNNLLDFVMMLSPKVAEVVKSIKITDAKVSLEGETKKIANWECTASEFEMIFMIPAMNMMPKFKMRMWITQDLPKEYEDHSDMGALFMKHVMGTLNIDEKSQKEMAKLEDVEGFQIAAEISLEIFGSQINVESQTLEVMEKSPPPGIYSVPKGYTKKDIDFIKEQIKQIPNGHTAH